MPLNYTLNNSGFKDIDEKRYERIGIFDNSDVYVYNPLSPVSIEVISNFSSTYGLGI
jgi:hypothetical protein